WEPRLLVAGTAVPGRLVLKAGLGRYHQVPQVDELLPGLGNPLLRLQSSTTYVAGLEITATGTLRIEAQGFYKELRDLVVPAVSPYYTNEGQGRVYGGELLVRQELFRNFF